MPPIRLDHIAIALPRIADAPPVRVAVLGGVPERMRPAGAFRWASWTYAVDPTAAEGPLAIELASRRGLAGLNEASARLGIQLAQRPGI